MPIYEYQCESCGHRQDALQRMSDDPLVDCAACGRPTLKKLMSAPRFRLKGSGWYETDFKSDNKRNLADGGDGAKGADGAKGEGSKGAEGKGTGDGAAKGASKDGGSSDSKSTTAKSDAPAKKSSAAN